MKQKSKNSHNSHREQDRKRKAIAGGLTLKHVRYHLDSPFTEEFFDLIEEDQFIAAAIGARVLKHAQENPDSLFARDLVENLDRYVEDRHRNLFGLGAKDKEPKKENLKDQFGQLSA